MDLDKLITELSKPQYAGMSDQQASDALNEKNIPALKPNTWATELTAIQAKTDNLPASPAAAGGAMTVADKTGFKLVTVWMQFLPPRPQASPLILDKWWFRHGDGSSRSQITIRMQRLSEHMPTTEPRSSPPKH